jgi:hypothetical protein
VGLKVRASGIIGRRAPWRTMGFDLSVRTLLGRIVELHVTCHETSCAEAILEALHEVQLDVCVSCGHENPT